MEGGMKEMPRVFNIMQYLNNPYTGEKLIDESQIQDLLEYQTIKQYAYILHDKDVFDDDDENEHITTLKNMYKKLSDEEKNKMTLEEFVKEKQWKRSGELKPPHYHIVLRTERTTEILTIARWLGIEPQYINKPHKRKGEHDDGKQSFWDCVRYLTHESEKEQEAGKYRYDDSEVICNFDFREEVDKNVKELEKYGKESERDYYRRMVLYEGMTLKEVRTENPDAYMRDMIRLDKNRLKYLEDIAQIPLLRVNLYIDGPGGIGKNTASKALAACLFPDIPSDEVYFETGGDKTTFEGYDGQPVIIWNDFRARDLILTFNRGQVFNMFDSHPTGARQNIKYSSIRLINSVNIINGVEPYEDFLNGLSGEYTDRQNNRYKAEDKSQAYRRFPIIICLRENDFDVLFNKGVFENTREFLQYVTYKSITGSFARVAQCLDGVAKEAVLKKLCEPIKEKVTYFMENSDKKITEIENIPDEFKEYGNDSWEANWK